MADFWRCADGSLIEPLDLIHILLFPNRGYVKPTSKNVCLEPRHFNISPVSSLLPAKTGLFTPDDLVDGFAALTVLCALVAFAILVTKYVWEYLDPRFSAISPSHKKWYVVANMSKGFWLLCMSASPKFWKGFYSCFMLDKFQTIELKRTMAIYIATDTVALVMVPKLPFSTIMHHVVTTSITIVVFCTDVGVTGYNGILGPSKMSIVYGLFSTITFAVNCYLALRVVYPKSFLVTLLRWFGLVTYVACCGLNWSSHLYWLLVLSDVYSIFTLAYVALLVFVVRDDVILILWLIRRSSPMAAKSEGKSKKSQ